MNFTLQKKKTFMTIKEIDHHLILNKNNEMLRSTVKFVNLAKILNTDMSA